VESLPVHNTEAESPGGGGQNQNGNGGGGDVADDHTDARQTHNSCCLLAEISAAELNLVVL
jgi:hypothetical protein